MKYVSMDLETTGLDPMRCQILECGALIADTSGNIYAKLHLYVHNKTVYGEPYALTTNAHILDKIEEARKQPFVPFHQKDMKNYSGCCSPDWLA